MAEEIKQLPPEVADQISAGEVIERPASVVKELVENSIDAESDDILIEIDNGGKDRIRVKDNGKGINADEFDLAFSRYATSKIDNINDLYSLRTLGFRGEALASIASVSRIKAISKSSNKLKGSKIEIKGSKIVNKEIVGAPQGTDINVLDLFYNTPARYKYMKTINTELGHISNIINREALAYPEIQFTLKHNKRLLLKTPGTGKLKDAIFSIYGKELTDNLIPVEFEDRYIKVKGYIARPDFNRSSRIYEIFFVNKRSVKNNILNRGVEEGYKGLLSPGTYPAVFLFLKLNPILVDVNVHPTKREVKFSRNQIIKDVIRKGIRKKLQSIDPSHKLNFKNKKSGSQNKKNGNKDSIKREKLIDNKSFIKTSNTNNRNKKTFHNDDNNSSKETSKMQKYTQKRENMKNTDENRNRENVNEDVATSTTNNKINDKNNIKESSSTYKNNSVSKILGQIHNTYIIAEIDDGFYIIDQHAAHERILYEHYLKKYNSKKVASQSLLTPINIELTLTELEIIKKYKEDLENLGLKLETFGTKSIIVQEIPVIMKKRALKKAIKELIDNLLEEGKTMEQAEIIDEIITYLSCHSAVKAGEKLDSVELEKLINDLFKTSNPFRCPHGRPTIIHLSEKELEKEIGRR